MAEVYLMGHSGEKAGELTDTSDRARRRYLERLRETSPRARLEVALRLSEKVRNATMADVRRQNPSATEHEVAVAFVRRVYGEKLAERLKSRLESR